MAKTKPGTPAAIDDATLSQVSGGAEIVTMPWHREATEGADLRTTTYNEPHLQGLGGNDTLSGLAYNDSIEGGAGSDRIDGAGGQDTLVGGTGDDRMRGGFGSDTFIITPGDGNDTVQGQRDNALGEALSARDVDTIVINNLDWDQVQITFTKGGLSGEVGPDGTQKLHTNSAGTITLPDGQKVEFRGIERIQLPHDR